MRRKLKTKRGRQRYVLRKELSEPVFGQIKQARGFRQFPLRGKENGEQRVASLLPRAQPAQNVRGAQHRIGRRGILGPSGGGID